MVLGSSLSPHRRHNTGHRHNRSLFYQKGQAVGQCSIQAPDQTCSIHMQEQPHRLGQGQGQGCGTGTIGYPKHPCQVACALLPPVEQGDRGLGCFPMAGILSLPPGRKSTALNSVWGWHSLARWKGPAQYPGQCGPSRKKVYGLSSPQQGWTLIPERLSITKTKPHST